MNHQKYSLVSPPRRSSEAHFRDRPSPESGQPDNDADAGSHDRPPGSIALQRSWWVLILASFYAMLALSSWIILCILSIRPLTAKSYEAPTNLSDWYDYEPQLAIYTTNEKWYQAARVIQSTTGILTIPLASAVCSAAAVVFIQSHAKASKMTMRQLLALADKGWTDTSLYWQLIRDPKRSWKRYVSSFLLLAIALHFLGGLISPLQALLLSSKAIKVTSSGSSRAVPDIAVGGCYPDSVAAAAIPTLNSAMPENYDQLIWQSTGLNCSAGNIYCAIGNTLADLSPSSGLFLAPLPNGYNTGVLRQYAPRYNSSAKVTSINPSEFPSNCSSSKYAFHTQEVGTYFKVEVCFPLSFPLNHNAPAQAYGPWKNTRDRQDFTEELFINVTFIKVSCDINGCDEYGQFKVTKSLLKVTAHTTAGWFELPNYMNSGIPGPLEVRDPTGSRNESIRQATQRRGSQFFDDSLRMVNLNPGPLLSLAWAMFGSPISYMASCATALSDPELSNRTYSLGVQYCSQPPLWGLWTSLTSTMPSTIAKRHFNATSEDEYSFLKWLSIFHNFNSSDATYKSNLEKVLSDGLFLTNEACIELGTQDGLYPSVSVVSDMGRDTNIPTISRAGLVVISTLLTIYLLSLLSVASYAALAPRWTEFMDGFAMLRIGSAIAERVPLLVTYRNDEISTLDDIPGWIGSSPLEDNDGTENHKDDLNRAAKLGLGLPCTLRAGQKYTCYSVDYNAFQKSQEIERKREEYRAYWKARDARN